MAQDFANQRLGVNISVGTGLAQTGTVVLSNSNGISFGVQLSASSYVITANHFDINGIIAGTQTATNGSVSFANSNGITFGMSNSSVITARLVNVSLLDNPGKAVWVANAVTGSSNAVNLSVQRFYAPFQMSATELDFLGALTVVGSTAGSMTISAAVYTFSGSTASSASSSSVAITWNSGTNSSGGGSIYGGQSGTRWRTMPIGTMNLTLGEYLLGVMVSIQGPAGTTGSMTFYGGSSVSVQQDIGATLGRSGYFADGMFSVGTGAFPSSIHLSDVVQSGTGALRQPYFRLIGTF